MRPGRKRPGKLDWLANAGVIVTRFNYAEHPPRQAAGERMRRSGAGHARELVHKGRRRSLENRTSGTRGNVMAADKPSVREMYRAMVDDPVSVYRHVGRGEFHVHRRVFDCVATSADPRVVHHVLVANAANYRKTPIARSLLEPILGRGLLTSEGDFWRRQRRIEAPAFHRKRIEAFADVMTELAHDMTESWESAAESGEPLDLQSEMSRVTMKIIVRAMFSDRLDEAEAHGVSEAMRALDRHRLRFRDFIGVPEWLPRRRDPAVRAAVGAIDRTVNRIIAERRAQGEDRGDLLSMMMLAEDAETGERMTDRQLRDETITIFLAGHETTATALVWTFYALHRFPEVEARLHAEVDSALGNAPPRLADLANLSWTRMTVEETMRLYPTVAMLSRQAVAGDEILGVRVPRRTIINLNIWLAHRNPENWPDPERFDPERFDSTRRRERPKHAYFPFGSGPRICIGNAFAMMEAQLILAAVARRWRLRVADDREPHAVGNVVLRPRDGLPVTLERRRAA